MYGTLSFGAAPDRFCKTIAARDALSLKALIGKGNVQAFTAGHRRRLKPELVRAAHDKWSIPESLSCQ
jgi:hypothetical protein